MSAKRKRKKKPKPLNEAAVRKVMADVRAGIDAFDQHVEKCRDVFAEYRMFPWR